MPPPAPPSLVKLAAIPSALKQGLEIMVPNRDQVPELMNAQSSPLEGMAATAAPVSWLAGAITCAPRQPGISARAGHNLPSVVPERTTGGHKRAGKPNARRSFKDHRPEFASSICVVLAIVYSQTRSPLSSQRKNSAIISQPDADSNNSGWSRFAASICGNVLMGIN